MCLYNSGIKKLASQAQHCKKTKLLACMRKELSANKINGIYLVSAPETKSNDSGRLAWPD